MTDDELERLLGGAFDAKARNAVPDGTTPPPMRGGDELRPHRHRRPSSGHSRWLAPLAAAAVIVLVVATIVTIAQFTSANDRRQTVGLAGPSDLDRAVRRRSRTPPRRRPPRRRRSRRSRPRRCMCR